jgi:ribosomal-protein-alanine N-acetyltransferase
MSADAQPTTQQNEIYLRHMTVDDLGGVHEVERLSFKTPWSTNAFLRELTENIYADYIVAMCGERVVGYAGMWIVIDEAHVTNIAVHPEFRGRKIGERLLTTMFERAKLRGALRMTLEVRPSNDVAKSLYGKHGFLAKGLRKNYYSDTGEDAVIMWKYDL